MKTAQRMRRNATYLRKETILLDSAAKIKKYTKSDTKSQSAYYKKKQNKETKTKYNKTASAKKKHIKKTEKTENQDETSSDDEFIDEAASHLKTIKRVSNSNDNTATVKIHDVDFHVEMDRGADENVMDEHRFKALQHRSAKSYKLEPTKKKLANLMTELPVKGEFAATIRNQTCGVKTSIVVVRGHMGSSPLISRDTLDELGMISPYPDGALAQKNQLRIKEVHEKKQATSTKDIVDQYKHVFSGIGKIEDKKGKKEIYANFHMRPGVAPEAQ